SAGRSRRLGPRAAADRATISPRPTTCRESAWPGSTTGTNGSCECRSSFPPERLVGEGFGIGVGDADVLQHHLAETSELAPVSGPTAPFAQRRDRMETHGSHMRTPNLNIAEGSFAQSVCSELKWVSQAQSTNETFSAMV